MINQNSLDTLCAALSFAMGIDAPECAATPNNDLCNYIGEKLGDGVNVNEKVSRALMNF